MTLEFIVMYNKKHYLIKISECIISLITEETH